MVHKFKIYHPHTSNLSSERIFPQRTMSLIDNLFPNNDNRKPVVNNLCTVKEFDVPVLERNETRSALASCLSPEQINTLYWRSLKQPDLFYWSTLRYANFGQDQILPFDTLYVIDNLFSSQEEEERAEKQNAEDEQQIANCKGRISRMKGFHWRSTQKLYEAERAQDANLILEATAQEQKDELRLALCKGKIVSLKEQCGISAKKLEEAKQRRDDAEIEFWRKVVRRPF